MARQLQTSERATKNYLETRYYRTNAKKMMDFLEKYFEAKSMNVIGRNDEYGEITATAPNYDMTVKIFQFSVSELSVDLYIVSNILFDFGKSKKIINDFFNDLAKEFTHIGNSLHKEK